MPVPPAPGCGFPPDWGGGTGAGRTDTHDAFDGPDSPIRYQADNTFSPDGPLPGTQFSSFAARGYAGGMNTPMSGGGGITVAGPITSALPTKAGSRDAGQAEDVCNPTCGPRVRECCVDVYCYPTGIGIFKPWVHCYFEVLSCDGTSVSYELNEDSNREKDDFARLGGKTPKDSLVLKGSRKTDKNRRKDARRHAHCCFACEATEESGWIDPCKCVERESSVYPFRPQGEYGAPGNPRLKGKRVPRPTPALVGPNSNTYVAYVAGLCGCKVDFPDKAVGHDFLDGGLPFDTWRKMGRGRKYKRIGDKWRLPGDRVYI